MYEKVTPESVGVRSEDIKRYVECLENASLATHSIVMMKHGKVFYEAYWKPFNENFLHRMYSVSKSFVALAVGFLEQDGLISLDDKIIDCLDEETTKNANDKIKTQTVRDMLMMCTGKPLAPWNWFESGAPDRVKWYFDTSNENPETHKTPGTIFEYDSTGSFVLGAMVEKKTGKKLMEYLREKMFDKIGVSKEAYCLECPGGNAWGDSAALCTSLDLAKIVNFTMNMGRHNGEQILNEKFVKDATSNLVSTSTVGFTVSSYGYGYLIWRTRDNSFFFNGMGCQFGIAIPDKDMVFVINSDNQGILNAKSSIIDPFYEIVVHNTSEDAISENEKALKDLTEFSNNLKLFSLKGSIETKMQEKINGKTFKLKENPMGIKDVKFIFNGNENIFEYTNAQGKKELKFGINENAFGKFPQEGYSDMVGGTKAPGNYYDCAASLRWTHENQFEIFVQVIDKYMGRLHMQFALKDENTITISMSKVAENFMNEYQGYAEGKA